MSARVTVIGGRGYTGELLLELIERHPTFSLRRVGSRSLAGKALREVFPKLSSGLAFEAIDPVGLADASFDDDEAVILALPNGEAAAYVDALPAQVPVVDLSADHRFDEAWYYGLPELNPRRPDSPRRVANPGCYATAVQLALAPLAGMFAAWPGQSTGAASADRADNPTREATGAWPTVFGVSGYSGAGRKPSPRNDPARLADNLIPYALCGHMHEREVSHRLGGPVRFMPHVAGFFRGISVTCTVTLAEATSVEALLAHYGEHYAAGALVDVVSDAPELRTVVETPRAAVGGFAVDGRDPRRAVIVAVLDNLLKGAASQAIQNLNGLFGQDELAGLLS